MNEELVSRKQALRRLLRDTRRALTSEQRMAEASSTAARVWSLLNRHTGTPLASYLALGDELDLDAVHRQWWACERPIWFPRVSGPGTLTWHPLRDPADTLIGRYGIREPDPARVPAALLPTDAIVLVPGIAFTRDGRRLGQGQGFYDRVLSTHRGHTIGIGYRCQLVDEVPTEPHDQRVAAVVLGGEVYP